jgi:hypothetical protein
MSKIQFCLRACVAYGCWPGLRALARNERGSISLATVFALLLLVMLLGMVINVGKQVDSKVKMQNAADAATYSGGIVIARGMNSLAFTNHMLSETMALTAIMREGRDRHAEPYIPSILAAWDKIGPVLSTSGFEKFDRLGPAIPQKTPAEQEMVTAFGDWMAATSEVVLPILEDILNAERIPQLQRQIVAVIPEMSQAASGVIADRHTTMPSSRERARNRISGVLWRTIGDPTGGGSEETRGTLPVIDPVADTSPDAATYQGQAIERRNFYAKLYLGLWNNELMYAFDTVGQMSQLGSLWREFSCGQLNQVFEENSGRNYPHVIRRNEDADQNTWLERDYTFVGVTYRRKVQPLMARLYRDSLLIDSQAFAQGMLFAPRRRPVDVRFNIYGQARFARNLAPGHWDLWNQNWSFQLMPATATNLPMILQSQPQTSYASGAGGLNLPRFQNLSVSELQRVNSH